MINNDVTKEKFGVLLSFLDGRSAGLMEFMPIDERKRLYSTLSLISENKEFKFIQPIKCRIKYRNLTKKGKLRMRTCGDNDRCSSCEKRGSSSETLRHIKKHPFHHITEKDSVFSFWGK